MLRNLLSKLRVCGREAVVSDAYDAGKRAGRLLARDIYTPLIEAARQQSLSPAQLAEVAEFVEIQAAERLSAVRS